MNEDISSVVSGIEFKIHSLCSLNNKLHEENEQLKNQIVELKKNLENYNEQVSHLENKTKLLKLSKSIENKRELTETKLKINELVREIDKCILMLNQ